MSKEVDPGTNSHVPIFVRGMDGKLDQSGVIHYEINSNGSRSYYKESYDNNGHDRWGALSAEDQTTSSLVETNPTENKS